MLTAPALPSSWEELPPDLLGLVLALLPCLADRVRLRAVCRTWRAAAAAQRHESLPPPLPWLALRDGSLISLDGAPVSCAPIIRKGVFSYRAVGNLAFLVHADGQCSLMNPLSGLTLPLPGLASAVLKQLDESKFYGRRDYHKTFVKMILSSPLDSAPDPLVAGIVMDGTSVAISACKQQGAISFNIRPKRNRRIRPLSTGVSPPGPDTRQGPRRFDDIAFLHGRLYALTRHEGLRVIDLDSGHLQEPKLSSGFQQCIADDPNQQEIYTCYTDDPGRVVLRYLVESNGRLLMVRRWMSFPRNCPVGDQDRTYQFEVFEADLSTIPGCWMKVDTLGDQAVFLGSECSKSVLASRCSGGIQEDCIYFMHRVFDNPSKGLISSRADPLADSGVYSMRNGEIKPLLPTAVMAELQSKIQYLTWFFPADA
ncbi:hypothetical protein PR202_ga20752 [Eleusine coracana subsp. coracana]|uniref:F-box domain-containing protein n=1 Tax=Eleusine coracana subsp. coracana TaxID=191504 RepID=A0AAV5CZM6_ELECO|nr:hypothetical protein QOZ80_8AG0627730 [Eleusine coracana subsp. coracana]GJN03322.1 hypothetical protein PR202_ga20752 [Eleusine coracana subsp. coracana]